MIKKVRGFMLDKRSWQNIAVFIFLLLITFVFLLESPLHVWKTYNSGNDSSVFQTVALMMERGYMPYRDSFDHKGPLLYLINYFGMCISYYHGIWIVEFAFLMVTLTAIYKICRLNCGTVSACISTLVCVSLLYKYFEWGNLVEEYAMPYIAIALYIFLDYFTNGKIGRIRLLICGFSFGSVFLLRANMVSLWIVFCLAVVIKCLRKKQYRQMINYFVLFMIGLAIVVVPVFVWLVENKSLSACWHDYIYFNSVYTSAEGGVALLASKWNSFFYFLNEPLVIISLVVLIYSVWKKENILYGVYACYLFCTLFFICVSGRTYAHYGMILIPAIGYPIALIYKESQKCLSNANNNILGLLLSAYFLSGIIMPGLLPAFGSVITVYNTRNEQKQPQVVRDICGIICNNTSDNEKISVYGNWNIIYVLTQREHATRFSYVHPIAYVMPSIMQEYIVGLEEELPPIVVVPRNKKDNIISDFLMDNEYNLLWSEEEDQSGALIYQHIKD